MSKVDGGEWGLHRLPGPERRLIHLALDRHRGIPTDELDRAEVAHYVHQVLHRIVDASGAPLA